MRMTNNSWVSYGAKLLDYEQKIELFNQDVVVHVKGGEVYPAYHYEEHPAICQYGKYGTLYLHKVKPLQANSFPIQHLQYLTLIGH